MFKLAEDQCAKVRVIGVGGAGGNMIDALAGSSEISGIELISANTDKAALDSGKIANRIQMGTELTRGRGAGADPEIGRRATQETRETIKEALGGAELVCILAGLGGGTGTGGAPIVADVARELGAFSLGIVTLPFEQEGESRKRQAEKGLLELRAAADTVVVIHNQWLVALENSDKLKLLEAFGIINREITMMVRGLADLINLPGQVNVDFADLRRIMSKKRVAMIRSGVGRGEKRIEKALEKALHSELFPAQPLDGACGVLLNIASDSSLELGEIQRALSFIRARAQQDAQIIFGTVTDTTLGDSLRIIIVIAADFESKAKTGWRATTKPHHPPVEDLNIPTVERRGTQPRTIKLGLIDDGECVPYDNDPKTGGPGQN